jgi:hypothetical protein
MYCDIHTKSHEGIQKLFGGIHTQTHRDSKVISSACIIFFNKKITPRKTVAQTSVQNFLDEIDKRPCVPSNVESFNREGPPPPPSDNLTNFSDQQHSRLRRLSTSYSEVQSVEVAITRYLLVQ